MTDEEFNFMQKVNDVAIKLVNGIMDITGPLDVEISGQIYGLMQDQCAKYQTQLDELEKDCETWMHCANVARHKLAEKARAELETAP